MAALEAITGPGLAPKPSSIPVALGEAMIMLGLFFDRATPAWLIVILLAFPFISHHIRNGQERLSDPYRV